MNLSNNSNVDVATVALVLIPVLILQVGLMIYALYDLFQEDRRVRGDSKAMWAFIIALINLIGPLLYFFIGRDDSRGAEAESVAGPLSLTTGAHTGPGTWAVAMLPDAG